LPRDEELDLDLPDFAREVVDRDFAARVVPLRPDLAAARVVRLVPDFVAEDRPPFVPAVDRLVARDFAPLRPAAERLADVLDLRADVPDFARAVVDLLPAFVRLEAALRRVVPVFRAPVERPAEREEDERDFDFAPTRSGFPLRLVDAILSSSSSDMDSAMPREAPLSFDFGVLPRLAESAAPAAFCWAPDFAGIL
jgi:hypothetical protein